MDLPEMKIRAIAPWFGGKRNLAPTIIELFGPHRVYWEPFCGSMAILMAKPACEMETVNDLHGDIINLAKVIQDKELGFQLYDRLVRTLCAEKFFRESKERWLCQGQINGPPDIERAYDYFVASWMGLNGVSGTARCNYQFSLRWCVGGGQGATRWKNVVASLPAWHKRLRDVLIIQRDGFEVIDNIKDEKRTVIYCDPPYFEKSDKYVHDFDNEHHERLARGLQRFKRTRVFVSYYAHPEIEKLYSNWERIHIGKSKQSLRNATRGKKKKVQIQQAEIIITNKQISGNLF